MNPVDATPPEVEVSPTPHSKITFVKGGSVCFLVLPMELQVRGLEGQKFECTPTPGVETVIEDTESLQSERQ